MEDLHADNIVPAGDWPVVVDWECALTPVLRRSRNLRSLADPDLNDSMVRSVLRTGLLPYASVPFGRGTAAACGLGAALSSEMVSAMLRDGRAAEVVTEGFHDVAAAIAAHAEELRALVLRALASESPTRVLVRPTPVYLRVIDAARRLPAAANAVAHAVHHDALLVAPVEGPREAVAEVVEQEILATRRGYVPRFVYGGSAESSDPVLPRACVGIDREAAAELRIAWISGADGRDVEARAIRASLGFPAAAAAIAADACTDQPLAQRLLAVANGLRGACAQLVELLPPLPAGASRGGDRDDVARMLALFGQPDPVDALALAAESPDGAPWSAAHRALVCAPGPAPPEVVELLIDDVDGAPVDWDGLNDGNVRRALCYRAAVAHLPALAPEAARRAELLVHRVARGGLGTHTRAVDLSLGSGYAGIALGLRQLAG